ncbi:hypothetical protein L596_002588 [Steinernema carpocapsae]|uniref:cystathionine gamma-lyase n=1 Tax=Steinernema carpocapsae TaxID=34508 RepID=A0A4U8URI2_STECR|nr:hypothetical protein L596_002588 [Steinernema carpocapsae]
MASFLESTTAFATKAIHAGQGSEHRSDTQVVPPLSLSSTHRWDAPGELRGHEYIRLGNPTRDALENALASLEDAKYAKTFPCGLAAAYCLMSFCNPGDHILAADCMYGGVRKQLSLVHKSKHSIELDFADFKYVDEFKRLLKPNTKMVWIESPSNPKLEIVDIQTIVATTKEFNKNIVVCIDSTFASSYFQKPLNLGVDAVMHSMTKYLNGHSDVLMGCVMTNDEKIEEHLKFSQDVMGIVPSTFDCYMANRSLKTLPLRMEKHMENALAIAQFLESHPAVESVSYPALPSHPQHDVYKKQMTGMSGMIAFFLKGKLKNIKEFLGHLKIITLAESLGGCESLIEVPLVMTQRITSEEDLIRMGITVNLVRISVGVEDVKDLIADLEQALSAMTRAQK